MTLSILQTIQGFSIDMDGVLFRGKTLLPGATQFIGALQRRNVPFVLLTNNSSLTLEQYGQKLHDLGFDVAPDQILTSAVATGLYLADVAPPNARVMVVGMDGLEEAVTQNGFELSDQAPDYVVAGLDRGLSYDKLATASLAIRAGAGFVATNADLTFPSERGLEPGAGAILASIKAATGVDPVVVGKPNPAGFDMALKRLGTEPGQTAMLGDRLETDISGGAQAGMRTILVLTGVTTKADLVKNDIQPDLIFEDLNELLNNWT